MRPLIDALGTLMIPAANRFGRALLDPDRAQRKTQVQIFEKFRASTYGRQLGIVFLEDWERIPIVNYDDLEPWIEEQRNSRSSLLTPDPILFHEKTSGSQKAAKWIPYTRALRRSFHHLFCIWTHDLIRHGPHFQSGRFYISITPAFAAVGEPSQGLQNDSDYLEGWLQWILSPFWITMPGAAQIRDMETFKQGLSLRLLQEESLEILSIWSPTFLLIHLDYIQTHQQRLLERVGDRISSERALALAQTPIPWSQVWPHLKLISCWDQAHAADPAQLLRHLFPEVKVQGKGLLATEAPMTLPLVAAQGCVPLIDEVFFEFESESGAILTLNQIQQGSTYSLIISQKGGLYRYRIGDQVRVSSRHLNTPCLEFIGRDHQICDLVGEKLNEHFVRTQLHLMPQRNSRFRCLVPCWTPHPHYQLILDQSEPHFDLMIRDLDRALQASPHYRLARQLGQLGPIQGKVYPQILEVMIGTRLRSGCRWGDIKLPCLVSQPLDLGTDRFS